MNDGKDHEINEFIQKYYDKISNFIVNRDRSIHSEYIVRELGKKAKEYMDAGNLVPDELVCDLVVDRLKQDDCKNGYILDGFPRTIPQAEALTAALANDDDAIDYAVEIFIEDQAIIDRMSGRRVCKSCGATYHVVNIPPKTEGVCDECDGELIVRDDDAPETVKKRLDVYHEQTAPLIDYYKKQGILKVIDGSKGLDTCFEEICGILEG